MKEKDTNTFIPGKRFSVLLSIDDNKSYFLGRFPRNRSANKEKVRLENYKGYTVTVIDTKKIKKEEL